ncbi:MAG TPA: hypothetical protein VJG90_08620 [Candidatus Nanoarchaeia archaeon]|nr:hypothetical protein [Candidatus Nanoarchaeia archaeon]
MGLDSLVRRLTSGKGGALAKLLAVGGGLALGFGVILGAAYLYKTFRETYKPRQETLEAVTYDYRPSDIYRTPPLI